MVINSLIFSLSGKAFISLSYLNDSFAQYNIFGWQFFYLSIFLYVIPFSPNLYGFCEEIS